MSAAPRAAARPPGATDGTVVSVVVVTYNSRDWIERCLASLEGATGHALDVVVVDNASADGSADLVAKAFPDVRLLRNVRNTGFARAVNRGAAAATGDYLLLLNPDGYLEPGCIDALVTFATDHPEHVIVGGRTVDEHGRLDPRSCWAAPSLWSLACNAVMASTARPHSRWLAPEAMNGFGRDHVRRVDVVTGCLLLIRLADWRALGGFDERFFVYGEDAEFSLRAAATTGRSCAITPDAVMVHVGAQSSANLPAKRELLLAGRITTLDLCWSPTRARAGRALVTAGVGVRALAGRVSDNSAVKGWGDVWRRRGRWRRGFPPATGDDGPLGLDGWDVADGSEASEGNDMGDTPMDDGAGAVTGRKNRSDRERGTRFLRSVLDPRSALHALRLMHYFHYTHVAQVEKLTLGRGVRYAPNVSFSNAERIAIGDRTRVGARTSLWAGTHGSITVGRDCNFAPMCFVTASNYGIEAGTPFLDQAKQDADVVIGDDVWLGTGVTVVAGVTIGSGTVVAAGAVVTQDLPAGVVAGGVPARVLRER